MKELKNNKIFKSISYFFQSIFVMLIKFYQACISPLFPGCCRFRPTCSEYALQAIKRFGVIKGGILSIKRILRCHPFGKKGYDPVPNYYKKK